MQNHVKTAILCILLFLFGSILFYSNILIYPILCNNENYILDIPKDSSASDAGKVLNNNGCINSTIFKMGVYSTFNQKNIKPGLYSLKGIRTLRELIKLITSVSKDRVRITLFEGWNIYDITNSLSSKLNINEEKMIKLCYDKNFIKSLGINYDVNSLEGFLYPDTYILLKTYNEKDILSIFTKRFMDVYNSEIYSISKESNLDVLEIITLASIIQGEAMLIQEMPKISSVYHNRLNKRMKLEADPTILYFMTRDDLRIFKNDPNRSKSVQIFRKYKNVKNKYNTYLNIGLPYGPINNPGLNALKATLFPEKTSKEYLYFVADGSGGHIFSENLNQHKLAIRKIRNGQKITK